MAYELNNMITEAPNINTYDIDTKSPYEILKLMNEEDKKVTWAIEQELHNIALAVKAIIEAFNNNGRLIYMGAGTSGRLGLLDAAECPPTFSTPREQVIGLIAGGKGAVVNAAEGAEDCLDYGKKDLENIKLTNRDIVVGITASGRTPYVIGGLNYAKEIGAKTISISCNPNGKINEMTDITICPVVGPEILTGSTRLKAGTAQKLVLNMLSTASMIGTGRIYKNLMIDVSPTNEKLVERAKRIIMMATGVDYNQAEAALKSAENKPKVAVVMIMTGCSYKEALIKIDGGNGFIHRAVGRGK